MIVVVCWLLFVVFCLWFVACCLLLLSVACWLLFVGRCLFGVVCLRFVVSCGLFDCCRSLLQCVVRCLLPVVR